MKIVLLNSCFVSKPRDPIQRTAPFLRLGVASIAAYLRGNGLDIAILDPQVEELGAREIAEKIVDLDPRYVGLPAYTEEVHDAAEIARQVKCIDPEIITVAGGYHVSALPGETLDEFGAFDLGVIGEGELPFLEIAQGTPPENVAGIAFRSGSGSVVVNPARDEYPAIDEYPTPAWDLYDLEPYKHRVPVEALRGCPFSCPFCFKAVCRTIRYKTPSRILDEVEALQAAHGPCLIGFTSSGTFPLNREHALAVCNGIIERGWRLKWGTAARIDRLDEELLRAMKESGCCYMNLGVESGDPEILARCQKGITLEQIERVVRLCHEIGIETDLNFILGLPGETRQSLRNTRRFAARLRPYSTLANFAMLTPFPGTEVYEMALRNESGFSLGSKDWRLYTKQSGTALVHARFADGELRKHQMRMYLSYYFGSPRKVLQLLTSKAVWELVNPRRLLALVKGLF